uniref:Uncharacterized protein n=1 Tax=Romanomermis culicivorax TaxID=13658 RepID=A0A915KKU0_ROMCU
MRGPTPAGVGRRYPYPVSADTIRRTLNYYNFLAKFLVMCFNQTTMVRKSNHVTVIHSWRMQRSRLNNVWYIKITK